MDTAIFNPDNVDVSDLPIIYGYNAGGSPGHLHGQLITEDGQLCGNAFSLSETTMRADLGILVGTEPYRHVRFRDIYKRGYQMVFVPASRVSETAGLQTALARARIARGA